MNKYFIIALLPGILLMSSCQQQTEGGDAAAAAEERIEPIEVTLLATQKVARSVEYTATLLAFEEVHLAPASPGRIENIYVEVGDRVAREDVLVQMDRTQLHQAEIQLKTLETDFRRLDTLQKVGSIARQQYDQLRSQVEIAGSNVEFLRDNTRLKAPFSGIISGKYYEAGEMYSGSPQAMTGKAAIVSLVQINRLKVIVPVSEQYFPKIHKGMEVKVISDIYPGQVFPGRIINIYPTVDASTRTFSVEVAVDNPALILRPGMFVRVSIDLEEVEVPLLPAIAVLKLQGSNERYLFVEENGSVRRVTVEIGQRFDDKIEVISDELRPGDRVVISGQARLLDGMKVNVLNP